MKRKPLFLITIDTEGDNLWANPKAITTRNARYLYRFQELCESYGYKPTYLTNFEMAKCPVFKDFGRRVISFKTAEIGLHIHAWNNPPIVPLTADDNKYHPYLIEYPDDVMRGKVRLMTKTLEDTFGVKMISHRAGRWSFNERYAQILVEEGYRVDCSVTPFVSWSGHKGDPNQAGGSDYTHFPKNAYWLDLHDISRPSGERMMLEIPVTIRPGNNILIDLSGRLAKAGAPVIKRGSRPIRSIINRIFPPINWLRPNGKNLRAMISLLREVYDEGQGYAEFMLHSSELMPNGSPTFPTERCIENLYRDIEELFKRAQALYDGATLTEYYEGYAQTESAI